MPLDLLHDLLPWCAALAALALPGLAGAWLADLPARPSVAWPLGGLALPLRGLSLVLRGLALLLLLLVGPWALLVGYLVLASGLADLGLREGLASGLALALLVAGLLALIRLLRSGRSGPAA